MVTNKIFCSFFFIDPCTELSQTRDKQKEIIQQKLSIYYSAYSNKLAFLSLFRSFNLFFSVLKHSKNDR